MLRQAALTIIAALLIMPCAHAQTATPAPLPPPILVPNVTPPLTIPSEMVAELQNGRILCERKLAKFDINLNHLKRVDFNGDGVEDFVMSSAGYLCNNSNNEFASLTGDEYFIFSSLPDGKYLRHGETIRAFEMTVDNSFTPPHLLFTIQCPHKFGREFSGHTRLRWNGQQLKAVTRNAGCDGTAPDAAVAAAANAPAPETSQISSGPQITRSKAPSIELDITNVDENEIAISAPPAQPAAEAPATEAPAQEESIVDVTSNMTPEPAEPAAPVTIPETETIPEAEAPPHVVTAAEPAAPQPSLAVTTPPPALSKAATLPGATFPEILPLPAAAPQSLTAEDILNAPVKKLTPSP